MVRGPNVCVGLFDDPERERTSSPTTAGSAPATPACSTTRATSSIVGRKKEIIIRGGINIAPREIEDLLCEMPEVRAAAVIGLPDERLGEIACACVVVGDGVPEPSTRRRRSRSSQSRDLATYKLPQLLRVVPELPDHAVGQDPQERAPRAAPREARRDRSLVGVEDVALTHGTARVLTLATARRAQPLDHATVARLRALAEARRRRPRGSVW